MAKASMTTGGGHGGGDTPTDTIVKAASQVHFVTDSLGRKIGVQKPSALKRYRVLKMLGGENSTNQQVVGYAMLTCCVTELNGEPLGMPNSERQIEALIERLGDEGFDAIGKCLAEQFGVVADDADADA
jgi:hypothetical protein